jgi:HK97 family phage major capsid protein
MATYTSTAGIGGILPDQYGPIITEPVQRESVAMQVSTVLTTGSHAMNIPVVTDDPGAAWVAEGAEITPDDGTFAETAVTPAKVAGLTIISRELADDSSPAALQIVGSGLARSIADQVDRAFFGALAAPAPAGLEAVVGVTAIAAPLAFEDLDPFAAAISAAETVGTTITSFVANPTDALSLAQLRDETGSNRPLLGTDPTVPTRRVILGVPLLTSPHVTAGTVWALPRDRTMVIRRQEVDLQASSEAYFSSDRIGVRAIMRIGFAFPHAAAIVRIERAAA